MTQLEKQIQASEKRIAKYEKNMQMYESRMSKKLELLQKQGYMATRDVDSNRKVYHDNN